MWQKFSFFENEISKLRFLWDSFCPQFQNWGSFEVSSALYFCSVPKQVDDTEKTATLPLQKVFQRSSKLRLSVIDSIWKILCFSWCAAPLGRNWHFLWLRWEISLDHLRFSCRDRRHKTPQYCANLSAVTAGLVWFSNQKEFFFSSHMDFTIHCYTLPEMYPVPIPLLGGREGWVVWSGYLCVLKQTQQTTCDR